MAKGIYMPARQSALSRRQFLEITLGATASLSSILALQHPPAVFAQKRELNVLTTANYVPASDKKLEEHAQAFAKQAGITLKFDHLRSEQMPAKLAAEVTTQAWHDVVELDIMAAWLHQPNLLDVSDLVTDITQKMGDVYQFGRDSAFVRDRWLGVPYFWISFPASYRKDLFEQVAEKPPDTWEDLLRAGRKLKKLGHPVGIPISQCTDAVSSMLSILWSYGAKVMEADGTGIAINSKETAATVEYVKTLYNEAMEPEVLSWDNAGNNRFMTAGKGSWIQNPASHYISAKTAKLAVSEQIYFQLSPAGPSGRHTIVTPRSMGIWKFSKQTDLGKEFIRFLFDRERYIEYITSSDNYNHPIFTALEGHPVWSIDSKYEPMKTIGRYSHLYTWPAPPDPKAQIVIYNYIIANMYAKAVTGTPTKEAIAWAEGEIKRVYEKS
ncbi:MAG: extracellular solute-binding protein [Nitrospinae bacterium]|nr:extracellular solute-binding protein [Nitrospinota bacterium]